METPSLTKRKRKPSKPAAFTGDHGTGTRAATAGTLIEPVEGQEHNKTGRRRRKDRLSDFSLSMRQMQAGTAIRDAWCRVEMLSSGSALKAPVDASPKPDAVIGSQVEAMGRLSFVMSAVPRAARGVVEHVCWHNEKITELSNGLPYATNSANFKVALDLVANKLRY